MGNTIMPGLAAQRIPVLGYSHITAILDYRTKALSFRNLTSDSLSLYQDPANAGAVFQARTGLEILRKSTVPAVPRVGVVPTAF